MIIDSHVHLLPKRVRGNRAHFCKTDPAFGSVFDSPGAKLASEEGIIGYLDRSGIDKAVVFGFPWASHDMVKQNNDEIWDFHERHAPRIIPFAVISPRGGDGASLEAARTLENGFVGIGEVAMYHGGWSLPDFEALSPILDVAAKAGAPILIHVNEPVGHEYPGKIPADFRGLLRIIEAHPEVDFILAHWGGGLFIYALMPEVGKVMARTYLDTAASPFLYSPQIFDIACRIMGPDKILFGSDFPLLTLDRYVKDMESAGVSLAMREAILGGNAARVIDKKRRYTDAR